MRSQIDPGTIPTPPFNPENWSNRALCRGFEPERFFPTPNQRGESIDDVVRLCGKCPVRRQCAAQVLAWIDTPWPIRTGIWAGVRITETHGTGKYLKRGLSASAYARLTAIANGEAI